MQCQHCEHANPEDVSYCLTCGAQLERTCPECEAEMPASASFCGRCGTRLSGGSPSARPGRSSPAATASRFASDPVGERRHATVWFSDLSGYTALGERLDPEEVFHLTNRILREAEAIVARHGGTANQFRGDEIMAVFGIPTAHEDDPARAVRAARELHAMVRRISSEVEEQIGQPLHMHSGINTGLIVSYEQDARRGRYDLTGDTVNTAARLTSAAGMDEIVVSPATQEQLVGLFRCEPLEPLRMKNKSQPMTPYRVLGPAGLRSRLARVRRRQLATFSGRSRELSRLEACLERAMAGQGQFVSVAGERGMGKSRLVYEFRQRIDRRWVELTHLRCEPGTDQVSYAPFARWLHRILGVRAGSDPATAREQLSQAVQALNPSLERFLPYYQRLLGRRERRYAARRGHGARRRAPGLQRGLCRPVDGALRRASAASAGGGHRARGRHFPGPAALPRRDRCVLFGDGRGDRPAGRYRPLAPAAPPDPAHLGAAGHGADGPPGRRVLRRGRGRARAGGARAAPRQWQPLLHRAALPDPLPRRHRDRGGWVCPPRRPESAPRTPGQHPRRGP